MVHAESGGRLLAGGKGGDDIQLFADNSRATPVATLFTLRQQLARRDGKPNVALADFVAPASSGAHDYVGAFVVTAGLADDAIAKRFEHANDDYSSIMVKALADRFAEALAEAVHAHARRELWAMRLMKPTARRIDRRAVQRHSTGARLSRATRPHRESDPVPAARRGARDRRSAHRELRHVASLVGQRNLHR